MASEAHLHESAPISAATAAAPASRQVLDGELDLGSIGRALWRRRMWLLIATGLVAALTFVTVNLIFGGRQPTGAVRARRSVGSGPATGGATYSRPAGGQELFLRWPSRSLSMRLMSRLADLGECRT